jgi:hypothetical protein
MDCIAGTAEEYVDLAVGIATSKDRRDRLRAGILESCGVLYRDPDLVSRMTAMLLRLERKD